MLRVYSIFLRLFVVRDITGFVHEIDHDVGLPHHVRRAYSDFTNDGENNYWTSGDPERSIFRIAACLLRCLHPDISESLRLEITSDDIYDVAVIGGSPAGATTACFLAQSGRRIVLIDKAQHPRFHIAESLLPHNLPILDRLGVRQAVAGLGIHKPGVEFVSPEHEDLQTFFFEESLAPVLPSSYQVRRADFDEILFRRAEAVGVVLKEGCTVTQSRRLAQGWRLELDGDEVVSEISARYLVDASGRDGLIARAQDLRLSSGR